MRKMLSGGSRLVWLFVLVMVALLALGLAILPEVFKRTAARPGSPAGLFVLSLVTLGLFVGVLISLALERWERPMVILFIAFRIGGTAWQYQLGRHSLWYLVGSVFIHLLVGALAIVFLSGRKQDIVREPPPEG